MVGQLLARLADQALGKDLNRRFAGFFAGHAAQVIPNPETDYAEPRVFEHAIARVHAPAISLRFERSSGRLSLAAAAPGDASHWHPVHTWTYGRDWQNFDWSPVGAYLEANWERLTAGGDTSHR